jgi:DNA invertase Pin-like site-specific DNA recombinase
MNVVYYSDKEGKPMKTIIAYIRVSTKRQGRSGLGLEAQQQALADYQRDGSVQQLAIYKEVETGKSANRPELAKAIAHAKRSGATLVVAKLDRLARDAAFLLTLQASGLPMVFLDLPGANEFTVGVMALVAQHEARLISERTKAALQAYKRRGGLLGGSLVQCRNLTERARAKGRKAASKAISEAASQAYADLLPTMLEWREGGLSQRAIADRLNEKGQTTRRGKPWNQVQVMRVLERAE